MKTKVLIVDDYNIFRRGLKLLIEKEENLVVVGEALNPDDLFEKLKILTPDLIVLDLMLPQKSVIAISKKLYKSYPHIPFIIITVNAVEYTILECVINGARGIIWKESTPEELIEAINTVTSGERYLHIPESKMVSQVIEHANQVHYSNFSFSELSEREMEVLELLVKGYSYKQMGLELNISPRTVESHKNNILSKLNLNTTKELISYAIKNQIITI